MYCTCCGVQNTDDANFCINCGKAISRRPSEAIEQRTEESELQETHDEPELQMSQEETSSRVKSFLSRIKEWSKKKKILAGIAVFFLFSMCVGAIAGEPVEETEAPKPFLEALRLEFEEEGFEYENTVFGNEVWRHPDGGNLRLTDEGDNLRIARLSFPLMNETLTNQQQVAMQKFVTIAVPLWADGEAWVAANVPIASAAPRMREDEYLRDYARSKSFVAKYHEEIVGDKELIQIQMFKNDFWVKPLGITLVATISE